MSKPVCKPVWRQDFTRADADLRDWNIRLGNDLLDEAGRPIVPGWGNNERQYYTADAANLYLDGTGLNLCARRQPVEEGGRRFAYTSARLDTKDRMAFRYGKLVVRARLPEGAGLWPAIWLMPQADKYGPWPASGEIDLLEARGRLPREISGTLHYGPDMARKRIDEFAHRLEQGTIAQDREYGLEWTEEAIRWLVDGYCYAERRLEPGMPFDEPFYLVLNLAVGGWYDDVPVDDAALPAVMTVAEIVRFDL
ncbi:glycoside hydrolase family 16 protein [Paenibacillus sp. IB182496]|uniref:Glycoside hydrolase family 16 protein n=1 Tax=Paenibacillus sabuli TaxID=2772509 RepID=A0A927BVD4_9BACL|nr:glycoside hydrolase family 16 protein [Paenibacillus sabuli]MBD2846355.1 glycoside hydrolase family 16 protein [Paenibacillus sabuli]